jgi:hypothetical protein
MQRGQQNPSAAAPDGPAAAMNAQPAAAGPGTAISTLLPHRTALLLAVLLAAFTVVRGVVPALSRVDSDFPNYLTAAKLVAEGKAGPAFYDDAWFRDQMARRGMNPNGKFSPFPPPTALLALPLASLSPLAALRVMTCVSLLALTAAILLLSRILGWSLAHSAVLVLLAGIGVVNGLRFGQPYILMSTLCLLGYYAWQRDRPWLGGVVLGLFVPIKYFPVIHLLGFALARQWRVALAGALSTLAVILGSIAVLGWPLHAAFVTGNVLGNHLVGRLSSQTPFAASYQSFDALLRRLLVPDPAENPQPWIIAPALAAPAVLLVKLTIILITALTVRRLLRAGTVPALAPLLSLLGVATLLVAPATASYHFVLLWLPAGLLLEHLASQRQWAGASVLAGCYALIGFFPYGHTEGFDGHGAWTVLSFPRLWLLLAMFVTCVRCLGRAASGTASGTATALTPGP